MMSQQRLVQLTPLPQIILGVAYNYPGQFSRSGQDVGGGRNRGRIGVVPGRLSKYRRKDVGYQIEILLQQHYLRLDAHERLVPNPSSARQA
jgi:hypothetical protein